MGVISLSIYDVWAVMAPPWVVQAQCPESNHLVAWEILGALLSSTPYPHSDLTLQ